MDRRNEVEALFEKALAFAPERRAAFLDTMAGQDPALYAEVVSLLEAHEDASRFFDRLSDKFVSPIFSHLDEAPSTPGRAGPYRIERELGQGGMSTVYLARRDDGQFEQYVALKVVRSGLDEAVLLQRFRSEQQILASLNHPHVARLYDGGVMPNGRPYLVMEYVEGEPIDRYCDARTLSLKDRLHLFQTIVETVQYAHRNLVVHRDLKPSNILVTDDGQVKLLDFGIAKILDDEETQAALTTQTGLRLMTPEYAAPEQIKGDRVTTATDVYQLGVLLYHLLTGHRPYRLGHTSTYEIERAVCEKEPTRPSTVVGQVEEVTLGTATVRITPEAVSQTRATELRALQRTLSGDLDAILLKALRKEPERRYATAEAFAEDIRRYLGGRPVKARRGTWGYRARKYIRRNVWGVAAIVVIAALIIGYTATFWMQAAQVAEERDRAQTEAEKAEEMADFLMNLFEISNPNEAQGDTITAREMLDKGARRVRQELGNQPGVQALMMATIGQVYEKLGLYDEALPLLDSSLALRRRVFTPPHPDLAEGLHALAEGLTSTGDFEQADSLLREAIAMWRLLPNADELLAQNLVFLALLQKIQGAYTAADSLYREALALQRKIFGNEHEDLAVTLNNLATLRVEEGRYAAADSLYQQALVMQRSLLGPVHSDYAATLNNLAGLRESQGLYPEADSLYSAALGIYLHLMGEEHPTVATAYNNLGWFRHQQGRYETAEELLRKALTIKRKLLGADHPSMAIAYYNLAALLHDKDDYAAAESLYRQTLAIDRKVYGEAHQEIVTDLTKLAGLLHDKGDLDEAEQHYRQALDLGREILRQGHPRLSTTLMGYGRVWVEQGRASEAEAFLREALAIRKEALSDGDWRIAETEVALGACLVALARYAEAETLLQQSYQVLDTHRGRKDRRTQRALAALIALYEAWGKPGRAQEYRDRQGD